MHKKSLFKRYQWLIVTIGISVFVGTLLYYSYAALQSNKIQQMIITLLPEGVSGVFILFFILLVGTSIGLPRQIAAFTSGFVLDVFTGTLLATIASVGGCIITLTLTRYLLSKAIEKKFPRQCDALYRFLANDTFLKTLIIRFIPAGNNLLTNMIAGIVQINRKAFILGSAVGFLPQMFIFSMMGNGVKVGSDQQVIVSIVLLTISAVLSIYVYNKNKMIPS